MTTKRVLIIKKRWKKATLITLNPDFGYFGAIYIKNKNIIFNLINFSTDIIQTETVKLTIFNSKSILKIIEDKIKNWDNNFTYLGTGVIFSYIVDNNGGVFLSNKYNSDFSDFKKNLKDKFPDITLVVENDANCSALYSYKKFNDKYKTLLNFLVYFDPYRLGCGIIINEKLYRGFKGSAGEVIGIKGNLINSLKSCNSIIEFLKELKIKIIEYSIFLNSEAIILAGDITDIDKNLLTTFSNDLNESLPDIAIEFINTDNATAKGISILTIEKYLNKLLN